MNPRYLVLAATFAAGCGGLSVPNPNTINDGVVPNSIIISSGTSVQFAYLKDGFAVKDVTWTCSAGAISSTGKYTAPNAAGSYTVTATTKDFKSSSADVTVP